MGTVALTRRGPWSRLHRGQAWGTVGIWECRVRSSSRLKLRDAALEGALQTGAGAASGPRAERVRHEQPRPVAPPETSAGPQWAPGSRSLWEVLSLTLGAWLWGGGACKGQKHLHGEFPAFAAVLAQWPQS